jgi:hypothetical protein
VVTADVVEVMMGGEDGDEPCRVPPGRIENGSRFGAVDDGGVPGGSVDQEVGVVVGELRDGDDFHEL